MSLFTKGLVELKTLLEKKEVSSAEAVEALFSRIAAVDPAVNAMVHRFDRAMDEAKSKDSARAKGDAVGPLFGLPVTVKESIDTEGVDTTLGLKSRSGRPAARDAVVVELLRAQGAIVIGKTNVSQLLLFHEAENALFGVTKNPWNLDRVPGGSSGGEAAAIAAGMSFAGVGTDIGGSIRIPCAFTGTAGIKPTVDRWSNLGCHTALAGQEVVRGQVGPMARNTEDVGFLLRSLDAPLFAHKDPAVCPLSFQDPKEVDLSGLRVGFFEDDGFLATSAGVRRATREAAEHLRSAGAEVVEFTPPRQEEIVYTYLAALSADGGKTVDGLLAGEPIVPQLAQLMQVAKMPGSVRKAAAMAMGFKGEARIKKLLEVVRAKHLSEYWKLTAKRTEIRRAVFDAWTKERLDAVICPAHITPALRHRDSGDFTLGGACSMRYNFLNFPAGVVGVSLVRASETDRQEQNDRLDRRAATVEKGSEGLPLCVQVVAKPFREDVVLTVMEAVERGARSGGDFPATPVNPGG